MTGWSLGGRQTALHPTGVVGRIPQPYRSATSHGTHQSDEKET